MPNSKPANTLEPYDKALAWWQKARKFLTDTPESEATLQKILQLEDFLQNQTKQPGGDNITPHLMNLHLSTELTEDLANGLLEIVHEILRDNIITLYYNLSNGVEPVKTEREYPESRLLQDIFDDQRDYTENGFLMTKIRLAPNIRKNWLVQIHDPGSNHPLPILFQHPNPLPCLIWMLEHDVEDF